MPRMPLLRGLLILALLGATGCHTMRFELQELPHDHVVREQKSFWFWGLSPTMRVDVGEKCPDGAVAIKEETTFLNGVCDAITLGIWSPRTSYYYCRPKPQTE